MSFYTTICKAAYLCVWLNACGSPATPPKRPPPQRAKPNVPKAAHDSAAKVIETIDGTETAYVYSPIGKRDPFRSLFDNFQQNANAEQLTDLQKFELDQFKLVAIVTNISSPYAMVEDPESRGHTLIRGKLIGKNWGRVSHITTDCVIIKEDYRDYTGRKITNTTKMCLPKQTELKVE